MVGGGGVLVGIHTNGLGQDPLRAALQLKMKGEVNGYMDNTMSKKVEE